MHAPLPAACQAVESVELQFAAAAGARAQAGRHFVRGAEGCRVRAKLGKKRTHLFCSQPQFLLNDFMGTFRFADISKNIKWFYIT